LKRVPSYDSEQWFTLGKLAGDSHDLSKYGSKTASQLPLGGSWLYEERFTVARAAKQIELECFLRGTRAQYRCMPLDKLLQSMPPAKRRRRYGGARCTPTPGRKNEHRKIEWRTEDQVKRQQSRTTLH
jgi:hypothetical protein